MIDRTPKEQISDAMTAALKAKRAALVRDRKTGKLYDAQAKFDELMDNTGKQATSWSLSAWQSSYARK